MGRNGVIIISKQRNKSESKIVLLNSKVKALILSYLYVTEKNLLFPCIEHNFSHISEHRLSGCCVKLESQA